MRMATIIHVATHCNYRPFVSALSMLDVVLHGERPDDAPSALDCKMMLCILQQDLDGVGRYARNLFEYFVIFVERIRVNVYWIEECFKPLLGVLVAADGDDESASKVVRIDNVVKVFVNCESVEVDGGPQGIDADESYLAALLRIVQGLDGKNALKRIELRNAHFEEEVVFDEMMESFFAAGFDVSAQNNEYATSLVFEAVHD